MPLPPHLSSPARIAAECVSSPGDSVPPRSQDAALARRPLGQRARRGEIGDEPQHCAGLRLLCHAELWKENMGGKGSGRWAAALGVGRVVLPLPGARGGGHRVTAAGWWKWEGTSGSHLPDAGQDTIGFFVSHTASSWSPSCPAGSLGPFLPVCFPVGAPGTSWGWGWGWSCPGTGLGTSRGTPRGPCSPFLRPVHVPLDGSGLKMGMLQLLWIPWGQG